MSKYAYISAAHTGCGLLVGHQSFDMATIIEQKSNRISFVAANGLEHHFFNCTINVKEIPDKMTKEIQAPIADKRLTTFTATLYTGDGGIHAGPYKNICNMEFSPPDADFAFTTAEGDRVSMSGGTIVVDEAWSTEVPLDYIQDALKAEKSAIVEQLFNSIENALRDVHYSTLENVISANLPPAFVQNLLENGDAFTRAHSMLRASAFADLSARLDTGDAKAPGSSDDTAK